MRVGAPRVTSSHELVHKVLLLLLLAEATNANEKVLMLAKIYTTSKLGYNLDALQIFLEVFSTVYSAAGSLAKIAC